MVAFLGKCTFSTKVILFSNDVVVLPRARDVLVARRSERQSRETSHSLGACFAQSIKKRKLSRTMRSVEESLLSRYKEGGKGYFS